MVVTHGRPRRKVGGALYHAYRKKKLYDRGTEPTLTKVGKVVRQQARTKGGAKKVRVLVGEIANIFDPKQKKFSQSKIITVVANTASRHFIRRNIITKGAIINTEAGKAKVTSRPGQDGTINAVLVSE